MVLACSGPCRTLHDQHSPHLSRLGMLVPKLTPSCSFAAQWLMCFRKRCTRASSPAATSATTTCSRGNRQHGWDPQLAAWQARPDGSHMCLLASLDLPGMADAHGRVLSEWQPGHSCCVCGSNKAASWLVARSCQTGCHCAVGSPPTWSCSAALCSLTRSISRACASRAAWHASLCAACAAATCCWYLKRASSSRCS